MIPRFFVLVLNEMVLVLVLDPIRSDTFEYEYEYEYR